MAKSNTVKYAGEYGGPTLETPGTHAPCMRNDPNTMPSGKLASNGVTPGSPVGPGGTFQDLNEPFPTQKGAFNARPAAGQAKSNMSGKGAARLSRPK